MRSIRHVTFFLLAALVGGCVGSPDTATSGVGGSSAGLFEIDRSVRPLALLVGESWREAPAGCEGLLGAELTFKVASATDGLVAAVDGSGSIVCVDTVESVQEELESNGDEERADSLGDQFLLAASLYLPDMDSLTSADPSPQPSVNEIGEASDPSPQPSSQPRR